MRRSTWTASMVPASDSTRTPFSSPPFAISAITAAIPRAVARPLDEGLSDSRGGPKPAVGGPEAEGSIAGPPLKPGHANSRVVIAAARLFRLANEQQGNVFAQRRIHEIVLTSLLVDVGVQLEHIRRLELTKHNATPFFSSATTNTKPFS